MQNDIIPLAEYERKWIFIVMRSVKIGGRLIDEYQEFYRKLENLYWKRNPTWHLQFKKFADEEFKEVNSFFGFYFISNYGQVISFHLREPRIMKYRFVNKYFEASLSLFGENHLISIHHLVFNHFCQMPAKKSLRHKVIHKNGCQTDNYYKNLRMVDAARRRKNQKRCYDFSLFNQIELEETSYKPKMKGIVQFQTDGRFIREFPSIKAASICSLVSDKSIRNCCSGKRKSAGWFQWRYKNDYLQFQTIPDIAPVVRELPRKRAILQFSLDGRFIREYCTIEQARREIGMKKAAIYMCAAGKFKTAAGFQWRFRNDPQFVSKIKNIERLPEWISPSSKAIFQFDLKGNFIKKYKSIKKAARKLGIFDQQITHCAKGRCKKYHNFQWRYASDPVFADGIKPIAPVSYSKQKHRNGPRAVLQFDMKGTFIKRFESITVAAKEVGVNPDSITACLNNKFYTAKKFQWKDADDPLFRNGIKNIPEVDTEKLLLPKPVLQFSKEGKFIAQYMSILHAAQETGVSRQSLLRGVKNSKKIVKGYQWKLLNDPLFKKGIRDISPVNSVSNW